MTAHQLERPSVDGMQAEASPDMLGSEEANGEGGTQIKVLCCITWVIKGALGKQHTWLGTAGSQEQVDKQPSAGSGV